MTIDVGAWTCGEVTVNGRRLVVDEVRETHTAHVFLTRERAYKVRKPVDLGFLDYSTPAKRLRAAREELRLGHVASAGIHLSVVGLTGAPHRLLSNPNVGEPVLEMKRLDDRLCASTVMSESSVPPSRLDYAIRDCVAFHNRCPSDTQPCAHWAEGALARMREAWEVNFRQMPEDASDAPFTKNERYRIVEETGRWLDSATKIFQHRISQGRVREGHGDLRLEHVYLTTPWSVIDPLEFSESLRKVDVASEVSFMAMELDSLGRDDASSYLVMKYANETHDDTLSEVIPFFKRYRATVRAKVSWIRSRQTRGPEKAVHQREARRLAKLALRYELPGSR